jgi:hypothetical protein
VLHVTHVLELGLQIGADTFEVTGFGYFLIRDDLCSGEKALVIFLLSRLFILAILQFHNADLRQNELLADAMEDFGRLRGGGVHEANIKAGGQGM